MTPEQRETSRIDAMPLLTALKETRDYGRFLKNDEGVEPTRDEVIELAELCHLAMQWFEADKQHRFEKAKDFLERLYSRATPAPLLGQGVEPNAH